MNTFVDGRLPVLVWFHGSSYVTLFLIYIPHFNFDLLGKQVAASLLGTHTHIVPIY